MQECKILNLSAPKHGVESKTMKNGEFTLYDYPEGEERVNAYLKKGWVISGFSYVGHNHMVIVLTR